MVHKATKWLLKCIWHFGLAWKWKNPTTPINNVEKWLSHSLTDLSWSALRKRGRIMWRKLLLRSSLGWLLALLMEPFNLLLRKLWNRLQGEESNSGGVQVAGWPWVGWSFKERKEVGGLNRVWYGSVMDEVIQKDIDECDGGKVRRRRKILLIQECISSTTSQLSILFCTLLLCSHADMLQVLKLLWFRNMYWLCFVFFKQMESIPHGNNKLFALFCLN